MIECGEIYYIKGDKRHSTGSEIWSGRPAIIISSAESIRNQDTINIVYLTSSSHRKKYAVALDSDDFVYKKNLYDRHVALCAQIHTVDKSRLGKYQGRLTDDELAKVKQMVLERTLF